MGRRDEREGRGGIIGVAISHSHSHNTQTEYIPSMNSNPSRITILQAILSPQPLTTVLGFLIQLLLIRCGSVVVGEESVVGRGG